MAKPYIFLEDAEELKKLWEQYDIAVKEGAAAIPGSDRDSEKMARWIEAERKQAAAIKRIREILGE
jgi:hypothetical protein